MFNLMKTAILMAAITALFMAIGSVLGGQTGMLIALVIAVGMNFFSYWFSDKLVLKMYNAQEVDERSAPQFYNMVKELAQRAQLPMPKVYLIQEDAPNAFATGRNPDHAAVAATTGILRVLSERELRGVMAHELAHVKHRDILISTVSATMAGAISMLANFAMFFSPRDSEGRPANPIVGLADPDGDQPRPRVRGGPRRRGDLRRPAGAGLGAGQDPPLRPGHPAGDGGAPSRDGPDDDHESAVRRRPARPVQHPSVDRGTHRAPDGDVPPLNARPPARPGDPARRPDETPPPGGVFHSTGAGGGDGTMARSAGLPDSSVRPGGR